MLNRISKREQLLFFVTVAIIGGFCLNWWVLQPAFAKSNALSKQVQIKRRMIEERLYLLNEREEVEKEMVKFTKYGPRGLSEEEETAYFLKEIEDIAKRSSVQIIDLKPYSAKKSGSLAEYRIEIEIESPINQLVTFIYNLQSSDGLLRTSKFRINPKEGNPSLLKGYITITKASLR